MKALSHMAEIDATTAAATRIPTPCIANMHPIKAPRDIVEEYSDMMVADRG